ncbi:hypothetical protein [Persicobacter psychrovividus]|uniref:Uncharacterized protein n=1 Tax=Persicobacter psychrovividus TaxID=387638 RepID=A0ABM7VAD0_9BACT|nr:hypothetical protein PEPS_01570 [Persicobacter psychrovividus]
MIFKQFISVWMAVKSILIGCPFPNEVCESCPDRLYEINMVGKLPDQVKESSGLAAHNDLFFTHSDSGGPAVLYAFKDGEDLKGEIAIPGVKNVDWEDLAQDNDGHVFIGDIGNNLNGRKDLTIYRYNIFSSDVEVINYHYEDQRDFPPKKNKDKRFDCEGMFWARGHLYLIAKIRGGKQVKIYQLPDRAGSYEAKVVQEFKMKLQVTGADISPDGRQVVLLSYGKVLMYKTFFEEDNTIQLVPVYCKRFLNSGQSEGVLFLDEERLLITNEKGKVFLMERRVPIEQQPEELKERPIVAPPIVPKEQINNTDR